MFVIGFLLFSKLYSKWLQPCLVFKVKVQSAVLIKMLFTLKQLLTKGFIIVKKAYLNINNGSTFMVLMLKQMILTSERHAEHPFASQNTQ